MGVRDLAATALSRAARAIAPPRMGASDLSSSAPPPGYEGASQTGRRLFSFRPASTGINSLLIFGGSALRARARWLVRNNAYARKAQRVFVTNVVGTGIRHIPIHTDPALKDATEALFQDWAEEADADGIVDYFGLQVLAARAMFDAGECFVRFRPRFARDGFAVPLQLQLLESEFCPYELNMFADNGNAIRSGVEFDKIGRRVAYWFWRSHPGEVAIPAFQQGYTRVPAEEVIHLFEPLRPGQIRGVSWLAAAIVRAWLLDQYEDAELERKKVAALFAGFITKPRPEDDGPISAQSQPNVGTPDASQNAEQETIAGLTPGMMQVLLEGEDIKFSEPADVGGNFEAFEYRALLSLCAAMDMPYSSVTGDRARASYSSERAAQVDLRAAVRQIQNVVFRHQLCRATHRRFMSDAILSGGLPVKASAFNASPREYMRAKFIAPRPEWVDPLKDVLALEKEMRNGLKSREAVIASLGEDLDQVDAAIARSNASADKNGLVLDSDGRRTNMRGSNPPPDTGTPAQPTDAAAVLEDDEETSAAEPGAEEEAA